MYTFLFSVFFINDNLIQYTESDNNNSTIAHPYNIFVIMHLVSASFMQIKFFSLLITFTVFIQFKNRRKRKIGRYLYNI